MGYQFKAVVLLLSQLTVVHASVAEKRFTNIYPSLNWIIFPISIITCNTTLANYLADSFQPASANLCYDQVRCILFHLPEDEKANEASASVLLGVIPSFLSSLGPTIPKISMLASRRPILALLLSILPSNMRTWVHC